MLEDGEERSGTTATVLRQDVRRVGFHGMEEDVECVVTMVLWWCVCVCVCQ